MSACAAVMTGRGAGAIATIQLAGDGAERTLKRVFQPGNDNPLELTAGRILLGHIIDGDEIVDQVTIGCEGSGVFVIHCHGNPLIVERIAGLVQRHGADLISAGAMLSRIFAARESTDAMAVEARLALATVKTLAGAEILHHQIEAGLSARIRQWRRDALALPRVAAEARQILADSEPARLLIRGCVVALVGPPNTGKSTLLNTLAGREKAVVTDVRGTTRDWVWAEIHIPPLAVTLIDTAGLDPALAAAGDIDRAAQEKSIEIIDRADLTLLVLDAGQPVRQLDEALADKLRDKRTIVVLNKADLTQSSGAAVLPAHPGPSIRVSAVQGTGIEALAQAVRNVCRVADFDPRRVVAFTDRQRDLLEQLATAKTCGEAGSLMEALLRGPVDCETSAALYNRFV